MLELGYVLLVVIAFLAMAVLSLVLKRGIGSFLVGVVGTLCFVVFGFVLSHTTKQNFFITGREGIIFTRPGITIFSPWKNIFRIANPPYWRGYDALQLREAPADMPIADGVQKQHAAMQTTKGAMVAIERRSNSPYDMYHYIPLLFAGNSWRKSELINDFEQYAPQVLQASPHITPQV